MSALRGVFYCFLAALKLLGINGVKIDWRQHQCREGPFNNHAIQRLASIGEQQARCKRAQRMPQRSLIQPLDQENTGLVNFCNKGYFILYPCSNSNTQPYLVKVLLQMAVPRAQLHLDFWRPLLAEYLRAFGYFKGQVLDVDALQGKLRTLCLFGCAVVLVFVAHVCSLIVFGSAGIKPALHPVCLSAPKRTGRHSRLRAARQSKFAGLMYGQPFVPWLDRK